MKHDEWQIVSTAGTSLRGQAMFRGRLNTMTCRPRGFCRRCAATVICALDAPDITGPQPASVNQGWVCAYCGHPVHANPADLEILAAQQRHPSRP